MSGDATTNAHLGTIADAAARVAAERRTRWLSVDSGPFAVRLASALGIGPGVRAVPPVLAVIGSITATTRDQVLETEQVLGVPTTGMLGGYSTVNGVLTPSAGLLATLDHTRITIACGDTRCRSA